MSNILEYKGYCTRIEYSAEDQVLHGKIEGIADVVDFDAVSADEIEEEFHTAVDNYLAFCESVGKQPDKEFKGSFNVRIDPALHRALFMTAVKEDRTLNQVVQEACKEYCTKSTQSVDALYTSGIVKGVLLGVISTSTAPGFLQSRKQFAITSVS